ncbi:1,6-anhydro-N-acetylmuramyl-L-alanine amidase AmpD [Hydrogenophilus thermoluteolus]|uniref:1,6-anhydro-N-acetylmuramyl-L-alanine amidase AmpD n=1 Tax=Hydrogenophilus thermoluteolus TaxID=297 RepID=A0A2Z6E078_HYDTE|nr:1,6-anhydro-N-acetylmuramyl-L-alanine amidase AmpD [Hydrogenophilus thermoluteolus]HCO76717.1 1,6-anhydro-N-acetylmuramyl-L-alanine amidase AmpD [Rhodocyclaceae bacterium]BBD78191.1 N-acetylmuramoyl-L-alanine amidase [Hydrogenophilus thermoluteolus]GLW61099.1 N-acetyl-anhydromuranmyl-L-alanine amidase [Hydrogenophilus thermoluteolus]HNQ48580.1 1,6-anhydro-N-acetylmuramyl-L-alanine amidase AmpD [Hydrogenophilus thermoluteolus]HNU20378.1 1,6-anhydro-N-acetylmuramyl-L-alanine amidase AmpD [Hyd
MRLPVDRVLDSPHADARPSDAVVTLAVIHAISLPPGHFAGDAIERFFLGRLDPDAHPFFRTIVGLRVSAHYLIRRDGTTIAFVPPERRAWHAGVSRWRGRDRCNDFSIGIELEGDDSTPFARAQYDRLATLLTALRHRFPHMVDLAGHCDIAPGRKTDPGPLFSWAALAERLYPTGLSWHFPHT